MRLTAGNKIAFILLLALILFSSQIYDYFNLQTLTQVKRVIDGDTLELANGQRIRLLGIDAPEARQPYHDEASALLDSLVSGEDLRLEKDFQDKDKYGRLLRYVFVDDVFVNAEIVRKGYAKAYVSEGLKYSNAIKSAEEEARSSFLGRWSK